MEQENKILSLSRILTELLEITESLLRAENTDIISALTDACYATAKATNLAFVRHKRDGDTESSSISAFLIR